MPTPPATIDLTPPAAPAAPGTISLSAASAPSAPGTIALSAASGAGVSDPLSNTGTRGVTVGGTLSPDATGFLVYSGVLSGYPYYTNNGSPTPPSTGTLKLLAHLLGRWNLSIYVDTVLTGAWVANVGTEATPDLAAGWAPLAGGPTETGTPTFALSPADPSAPSTISLTAASQPAAPGTVTPS